MNAVPSDGPAVSAVPDHAVVPESDRLGQLLSESARGHDEAFAELYDLTSSRVYGLILRVVRSPDHAAEVMQEVYVEAWRQAARYDPARGSVLAWMITMAHRRAVDRVRSVVRSTTRDQTYASRTHEQAHDEAWDVVEQRLDGDHVRTALASLSAIQQEALKLAYFGGYTHVEVARLLNLPLGTVKTRVRDGLIGLRNVMGVSR